MKKIVVVCLCLAMFGLGITTAAAADTISNDKTTAAKKVAPTGNPIEQLTGEIWMKSSAEIKAALLFGVECAMSIEHAVAKRLDEVNKADGKKKTAASTLSPFEKAWAQAFKDVPRAEIVENIDTWYAENPDKQERPVFDVIWYELIVPKTKK